MSHSSAWELPKNPDNTPHIHSRKVALVERNHSRQHGILWDVDGTLVDTAEQHFRAWVQLAREIELPFTQADFALTFGWRNPDIIRRLFDAEANDAKCQTLADRKEILYRESVNAGRVSLLPGVRELLRAFAAAGWPQAVGSSAPRENVDLLLGASGITEYFATIICGDDVTRGKPDPEVFVRGATAVGLPPSECVVFEDAVAGVQAARNGGMKCVAVTFVGHHPAEKLREAGATLVVESLEQVTVETIRGLFH
jgi:beta-phosphoglucomutase